MMKLPSVIFLINLCFVCTIYAQPWRLVCQFLGLSECNYVVQAEIAGFAFTNTSLTVVGKCLKNSKESCTADASCQWCAIDKLKTNGVSLDHYGEGACFPSTELSSVFSFCDMFVANGLLPLEEELNSVTPKLEKPAFTDQATCFEKSDDKTTCEKSGNVQCSYCPIPTTYKYVSPGYCSPKSFAETAQKDGKTICEQINDVSSLVTTTMVPLENNSISNESTTNLSGDSSQSSYSMLSVPIIFIVLTTWLYSQ